MSMNVEPVDHWKRLEDALRVIRSMLDLAEQQVVNLNIHELAAPLLETISEAEEAAWDATGALIHLENAN